MTTGQRNVDAAETAKFDAVAWWDTEGDFKPLHDINPLRLEFVESHVGSLAGRRVLDVGCGGGILSEAMARRGAAVTGIDATQSAIDIAKAHALAEGLTINYECVTAEELASAHPVPFELVTCMELLEHVPDPYSVVATAAQLCETAGDVVFSTINRNPKAYALAILGAEYVLSLVPRGTHDYDKFIRPSELDAYARDAGLDLRALGGFTYNPLTKRYRATNDIDVNYLAWFKR